MRAAVDKGKATKEKLSKPEAILKNDVDLTVVDLPDRFVLFNTAHWEVHHENVEQRLFLPLAARNSKLQSALWPLW